MTRRINEGTEFPSDEAQREAIQAQIKTIAEARGAIEAAMKALPARYPGPPSEAREQTISHLAEKYIEMALASLAYHPPAARNLVVSQISEVNKKAAELFELLERLDPIAVEALHLAMKELDYRPAKQRPFSSAVVDPRPKAIGDIKGRLEVLMDAADRAKIPDTAKDVRGAHRNRAAFEIATVAAELYFQLTNKGPDRSRKGYSFSFFLKDILSALDQKAKVDDLARQACEWWEKDHAETTPSSVEE